MTGDIHKAYHIRVGLFVESLISDPIAQAGKGRKRVGDTHTKGGEEERKSQFYTSHT